MLERARRRARGARRHQQLGADSVRSLVIWSRLAPRRARRPKGFKAADPHAYPAALWDPYDDLVRGTGARARPILSPSTPMPAWASRCKRGRRATCKPSPRRTARFVSALGRRYSGSYRTRTRAAGSCRGARWSLLNEPNQPGWLTPQYERRKAACRDRRARLPAARAGRHPRPARERPRSRPGPARRDVADRAHERIARTPPDPAARVPAQALLPRPAGAAAARRRRARIRLSRLQRLAVDGFAHHPYQRGGSRPPPRHRKPPARSRSPRRRGCARVLDQAGRAHRIPRGLPVFYTEFGFQTNPPTHLRRAVSLQPRYLNQSDWMAYRDRRVRAVAQYKLRRRSGARRASSPACASSTAAPSPATRPTGCRSG